LAKTVYDQVLGPISAKLGDKKQILISPDGALNLIPFAALVDGQDHFAVETYSFSYLTSGRDLLRLRTHLQSKQGPVIIADPIFEPAVDVNLTSENSTDKPSRRSKDLHQQFVRVSGTADEAEDLRGLLKDPTVLTGPMATESGLKGVRGPSLLHISTHGFFLVDQGVDASARPQLSAEENSPFELVSTVSENGLLRSGLALSGANKFLGGNGEDGILTAFELAGLDLWGTQLVVLSACETGLGDIQNGEGVYGLRRSLILAGAESELVSLWKVNSGATRELMGQYYARLACGEGRSNALQSVQMDMLKRGDRAHPYFWAGFIPIGQWTSLGEGVIQRKRTCSP
jgi:CHAT domain-containing protein